MLHIFTWMKREAISIIPAIIYFCITFNLIYFTSGLALRPDDVRYLSFTSITLGALIMGKVLIIINSLPFINAFPNRPMIYNIIWKFFIYAIFVFVLQMMDTFLRLVFIKHLNAALAFQHLAAELSSPIFWSIFLNLLIVFMVFIIFNEICRVTGKDKMKHMMFG